MTKKLALLLVFLLGLPILVTVPSLGLQESRWAAPEQGLSRGAASAYASQSRIVVEGADAVWETNTQRSEGLVSVAKEVPPRVLAEYADSVFSQDLAEPPGLSWAAAGTPARVLVEYADSIFSQALVKPEQLGHQAAQVSPRILVEYADSILSLNLQRPEFLPALPPTPTPTPPPTPPPAPGETPSPAPTPTPTPEPTPRPGEPKVYLHLDRTNVLVGEEIHATLSIVNSIARPTVTVSLILKVPSGWSVSATERLEGGGGQYVGNYEVNTGKEKHIGITMRPNEPGEFIVQGDLEWYFGEDKTTLEAKTQKFPVKVRSEEVTPTPTPTLEGERNGGLDPYWLIPVVIAALSLLVGIIKRLM